MIRVKIFCSFLSSEKCKEMFEQINYSNEFDFYGNDKKVYITSDDDYTHAIIINTEMPDLMIPKENVIGLAFEPIRFLNLTRDFVIYSEYHIGKYLIGDKLVLPEPFIEHFGYMWHLRPPNEITIKSKEKIMSFIVSNKRAAPGHIYRHQLIEEIIKYGLPIDIYGHGSSQYSYPTVKGSFKDVEPYENYLFSVCIENFNSNHYFSEKIVTPLLYNCMPIYNGCNNIDKYFDDIIKITGDIDKDIQILINILKEPYKYYKPTYNDKNKKTVNLIENIESLFS
jgi:hypothetical protein